MPPSRQPGFENTRSNEYWFCFSSPNVESHLIISISENHYLALAKGPLVEDHVLIVPVEHMPSTLSLSSEFEVELCQFQNSLQRYCKSQGKEVIFLEWVFIRATHANLQAIPIPSSKAVIVEKAFNLASQKMGFKFVSKNFDSISDGRKFLKTQADEESSLSYAEISGGIILLHHVEEKVRFLAQFGCEVGI
ncbi:zinc finger CCCH domain-containing protein 64-like [Arachis ipaensis]|uniref:zinc finger CCCH domain-containing protein 64-like n=1 Tax=Arachis ipaensis TaxID=130454 RepID=UPI000A2B1C92|nr:zinc finger CCCH domain-containing protein 64-like [Arachis ipaensis]